MFDLPLFGGQNPRKWGYVPKIWTQPRTYTLHLHSKFHHAVFNHLEVIVVTNIQILKQTNKQIWSKTYTFLHHVTPVDNNIAYCLWVVTGILDSSEIGVWNGVHVGNTTEQNFSIFFLVEKC